MSSRASPSLSDTHVTSVLRHGAGGYPGARGNICVCCTPEGASQVKTFAKGGQINLHISSRGTLSAHDAVFLTESDIVSLLFTALTCHDEHVSQQSLLEILAIFASNGPPVHLMGRITVEDFCQIGAGGSLCVGAHLPTVDENFRTYRQ